MNTRCKNCNKKFKPKRANNLYCSPLCKSRYSETNRNRIQSKKHKLKAQQKREDEQNTRKVKGVFTYEEIGYIVVNYNIKSYIQMSKDLDRTTQSIESKIRLLKRDNILMVNSNLKA